MTAKKSSPLASVSLLSLGCSKNLVDSESLIGHIVAAGPFALTPRAEDADIVIVNTCGFIDGAKKESIDTILRAVEMKREGKVRGVVVAGCLVQRYKDELESEIPEVDAFLGIDSYSRVTAVCEAIARGPSAANRPRRREPAPLDDPLMDDERVRLTPAHYAYIRVSEGCDNPCTFCIIPKIRGGLRSKPADRIVAEARRLGSEGVREVILIGQDTTSYGIDLPDRPKIEAVLRGIAEVPEIRWIRLLYAYPAFFTDGLLDALAELRDKCVYLDIPFQHVNTRLLKAMARAVDGRRTREIVAQIRERAPHLALRTTFIVGFPGETEAEFQEMVDFVEESRFDRLGAFTYSKEEGTPAVRMRGHLTKKVKEERYRRLMAVQQDVTFKRNVTLVGKSVDAIVDEAGAKRRPAVARTAADTPDIDCRIRVAGSTAAPGTFVRAKVTGILGYDLEARCTAKAAVTS
jgi:ribosomal protein S12 methylthiotransferase